MYKGIETKINRTVILLYFDIICVSQIFMRIIFKESVYKIKH